MQDSSAAPNNTVIEVDNVQINYETRKGDVEAIQGVSFKVREGETVGLVGESGCGKTTVGRSMLRLIEPTSGEVSFAGQNMLKLSGNELKAIRRDMQIIFQDPFSSLDPRMPIGESIGEGLRAHNMGDLQHRRQVTAEMLVAGTRCVSCAPHSGLLSCRQIISRHPK